MKSYIFTVSIIFHALSSMVSAHGRLRDPPSRSSLWRTPEDPAIAPYVSMISANYNDNELFCGGAQYQQNLNGKCGVCGDPYDAKDKPNEAGGKYGKGIIVRQFSDGETINATVEITAHHKGYFEFRLCPWNNPTTPITKQCLDQYLLTNGTEGQTKWILPPGTGGTMWYYATIKLPDGVTCSQCVLQWKYHTGNSYNCKDGECCIGCGPQEEFYGCADIAIGESVLPPPSSVTNLKPSTTTTVLASSTTTNIHTVSTAPTTTTSTTLESENSGACQPGESGVKKLDCNSFINCQGSTSFTFACPDGTVFSEESSVCDHKYNTCPPCGAKDCGSSRK